MNIRPDDPPVEVRDVTQEWACLALWGPNARHVLGKITASDVSNQAIPYLHAAWIDVNDTQVLAQRVSYVGELGWELYMPSERAMMLWDRLYAAGKEFGLEAGGYADFLKQKEEAAKRGRLLGIGISTMTEPLGAGNSREYDILGIKMFDSAELKVHMTGKAILRTGAKTQGQGHETTWAQIVAHELGIPAEDVTRIFDEFYQVEPPDTRHYGGLGIGLTIAKGLIEAQGGRMWAESEGPGRGSTFKIVLPKA